MKPINSKQNGIALIFVLLILVVVSLIGIGGAQLAMMGERGARNERDTQISRQYAEAALLDAELDIRGPGAVLRKDIFDSEMNFTDGCGTTGTLQGLCTQAAAGKPIWLTVDFLDTTSTPPFTTMGTQTGRFTSVTYGNGIQPALAPRYIVEWLPDKTVGATTGLSTSRGSASGAELPKRLYRVTAMGFGPRQDIQTVLQMVFRKEQI